LTATANSILPKKTMRDMDYGHTNEQVHKVMREQMKLQQEVFGLKRMSLVFVFIILFLSPRRSARALLRIAAKHDVRNGILVVKAATVWRNEQRGSTFTLTSSF
jgi:hypothetical protein